MLPSKTQNQSFPKTARLLKNAEFASVQKQAKRHYSRNFSAYIAFKCSTKKAKIKDDSKNYSRPARLGITISKKTEKLAVKRNRVKRIVRDSFRQIREYCPQNFCLVIVAKASCANLSSTEFKKELITLLKTQKILSDNIF